MISVAKISASRRSPTDAHDAVRRQGVEYCDFDKALSSYRGLRLGGEIYRLLFTLCRGDLEVMLNEIAGDHGVPTVQIEQSAWIVTQLAVDRLLADFADGDAQAGPYWSTEWITNWLSNHRAMLLSEMESEIGAMIGKGEWVSVFAY